MILTLKDKIMEKRNLTFTSDPGHGWLSVKLEDLTALGIAEQISSYSYMTLTRAYLEEDQDMSIFMKAAKTAGWEINIKDSYSEKTAIRHYPYYDAKKSELAQNLQIGTPVKLYNSSKDDWSLNATVSGFENKKIQMTSEFGAQYQISRNRFLQAVKPSDSVVEYKSRMTI